MAEHPTQQTILYARPLYLPNLVLVPGDEIIIVDSRGRVIKGFFAGYASKFIALADQCPMNQPYRFINIQRVNEILVLRRGACSHEPRGDTTGGGDDTGGLQDCTTTCKA